MTKKVGPTYLAGIDWAQDTHDIAVVDRDGIVVAHATVENGPAGVAEILLRVLRSVRHQRRSIPIGIERADRLLVEALTRSGQPVVPINPAMAARYRNSPSNTRRKSDKGDSADLARIIQRDGHRLRRAPDNSDRVKAIAVLARANRSAVRCPPPAARRGPGIGGRPHPSAGGYISQRRWGRCAQAHCRSGSTVMPKS
ncbi:transposase [Embleya sp. NPDC020630]|uniref:IS110 family transposase n=1 Tax=Embleya sp. NPDC020630 TaxID=3363979 RepID=UPI0037BD1B3E